MSKFITDHRASAFNLKYPNRLIPFLNFMKLKKIFIDSPKYSVPSRKNINNVVLASNTLWRITVAIINFHSDVTEGGLNGSPHASR